MAEAPHAALPTCRAPRSLLVARRAQLIEETQRQLEGIQGEEQPMKGAPKPGLPYRLPSCFSSLKGQRHCLGFGNITFLSGFSGAGESAFPMSSQETEAAGPPVERASWTVGHLCCQKQHCLWKQHHPLGSVHAQSPGVQQQHYPHCRGGQMEMLGFGSIKRWQLLHRPCSKSDGKQGACQALVPLVFRVACIAFLRCPTICLSVFSVHNNYQSDRHLAYYLLSFYKYRFLS